MIKLKTVAEISVMREGALILAKVIEELKKDARIGVTTKELDDSAKNLIEQSGGKPSFLNFEGYPAVLCTSLNEEIVHALPSERILREGDVLSLDLGIIWKGYHSDMAVTLGIGRISPLAEKLISITRQAMEIGIRECRTGNTTGDVGYRIQNYVRDNGFEVVRELCGHGIGRKLHEEPQILNIGKKSGGQKIKEGMVLCIEPMVMVGDWKIEKTSDGLGYKTKDNSLSCHFEHEIAVTRKGPWVLTRL
ncbi:MAG: type I methionyl aminopeptidase [Patescibacteria group bacterium]